MKMEVNLTRDQWCSGAAFGPLGQDQGSLTAHKLLSFSKSGTYCPHMGVMLRTQGMLVFMVRWGELTHSRVGDGS